MTTPTKVRIPTLYSGAYGYHDCDPIGHIVATSVDGFNTAMREAIDEETASSQAQCDHAETFLALCDSGDCDECEGTECPCCHPDIWYVGPYAESALAYLRELRRRVYPNHRSTLDNLRAVGVAWQ